jgi:Zn-dependent peptidase ImmA (M78 family)/transcriptional regulator with XRE-family HTH domain
MTIELAFNPRRLTFARKRRGLTKTRLAAEAGLPLRLIVCFEAGQIPPDDAAVQRLVGTLKFPVGFFFQDDIEELDANGVSFRSMSKLTAPKRSTALGAGSLALALNDWIEQRFVLPSCRVADLSGDATPEAAADWVRREWGLGETPIKNMVHLLESRGIRVFSLAIDAREVDAFSFWRNGTPFVFLNTRKSAERSRYDAAHELAHLVMHKHAAPNGQDAELQANAFASAFLMPRQSVVSHAPRLATVDGLIQLKKIWNVSVVALARRLHDIGIVTDWHYHLLCKQMSTRGYRTSEPEGSRREASQVLSKVMAALREDGISKADIARDLCVDQAEIEELIFGLAITGVASSSNPIRKNSASGRPELRVVSVS